LWSVLELTYNYIHNNPVEEEIVFKAECCVYNSVIDYGGEGAEYCIDLMLLVRDAIVR